ncbi:MBL fold metallo-hydrolase [Candidatus Marinimicrobia bacterium MT.SAG.3]|nr:MBL fold metallo-hydrolase [Candidatus Marinimicrobia bacterium MT.SAG.3]
MKLKIHRGTQEIGGSCVEIWTDNTRIIVDIGMPLVNPDGSPFDSREVHDRSVSDLVDDKTLPDIRGLYDSDETSVDAVLISHPHLDHYGLGEFVDKEIPFYIGKSANDLINITRMFSRDEKGLKIHKPIYYKHKTPFRIGDIEITPYLKDHSAFDAYGFLIEGDNKRVYYSGDFRSNGRKKVLHEKFIENPPINIDYLILEGTNIDQPTKQTSDEEDLEADLVELFRDSNKFAVIQMSSQNIDRLVSLFKACIKTERILILDIYTAFIIETLTNNGFGFPPPSQRHDNLRTYMTHGYAEILEQNGFRPTLNKFAKHKIKPKEIDINPGKYVMIIRPSLKKELMYMKNIDSGDYIYSMWTGYKEQSSMKRFSEYLTENRQFTSHDIHTSGHADVKTLKELADAINPKFIIPIHTFSRDKYDEIFSQPIKLINDGEVVKV